MSFYIADFDQKLVSAYIQKVYLYPIKLLNTKRVQK